MSAPSFLATDFAFSALSGVTDVQTIMDALATMLTATLSNTPTAMFPSGQRWTALGGGVYKSPVDAAGRFMTLTLVRTTIVRLRWTVADPGGTIRDGEVDIAAGGSQVEIYGGPGHAMVQCNNAGSWEIARAFMTDPTPEPLASASVYVYASTWRDTGGGIQGGSFVTGAFRFYGGTLSSAVVFNYTLWARPQMPAQDTANTHLRTQAGSDIATPFFAACPRANGEDNWLVGGRFFQAVVVDGNNAAGSDLTIPIDTGVTGIFRVTRFAVDGARQYAIRKG